jgi:hypothetical protein
MNYRFLIINSLLLLYWERQIENNTSSSIDTVKEIMGELRVSNNTDADSSVDVYAALHALIMRICTHPSDKIDRGALVRQVKVMANHDQYVADIITESVERDLTQEEIKTECGVLSKEVYEQAKRIRFVNMIKEVAREYVYSEKEFNLSDAARSLIEKSETYAVESADGIGGVGGVVDFVDFDDDNALIQLFNDALNEVSPDEILKFPLQGLNKMMGRQGGGRRGECCVVGGLSHHGKSVTAMMITRGIAMYNVPKLHNPDKIPTILVITSENDLTVNIRELYGQCYVNVYGVAPSHTPDVEEAGKFIKETFGKNGWRTYMVRVNPDEFTLADFQSLVYDLEATNHEIIVCCFDYLSMMSTRGIDHGGITGQDKQLLWKRVRNMFTVRKTFFISPHQLSTDALMIERDRPSKFLEEILNRGYYQWCKSLYQEVDLEINIQKYKVDGITYIGYGRGKHRGVNDTPEADKICWYQIGELGILDDINAEQSRAMDKPGRPVLADDDFWGSAPKESYAVQ